MPRTHSGASTPRAKPKTMKEIEDEQFKAKHQGEQKELTRQQEKLVGFVNYLCDAIHLEDLIQALDRPIEQDPITVLAQI